VTNLAWGGPDRKTLYITGDGGLYKVQLKVAGWRQPGSTALGRNVSRSGAHAGPGQSKEVTVDGRLLGSHSTSSGRYLLTERESP
jgi:hypothetical protein